jgi:hypothetical protein
MPNSKTAIHLLRAIIRAADVRRRQDNRREAIKRRGMMAIAQYMLRGQLGRNIDHDDLE